MCGLHHRAQLRLADQESAAVPCPELEVRQHAQLFDRLRGEILRLVDDEQRTLVVDRELAEKGFERPQQHGLADCPHRGP
jgi:hypothetical protein